MFYFVFFSFHTIYGYINIPADQCIGSDGDTTIVVEMTLGSALADEIDAKADVVEFTYPCRKGEYNCIMF